MKVLTVLLLACALLVLGLPVSEAAQSFTGAADLAGQLCLQVLSQKTDPTKIAEIVSARHTLSVYGNELLPEVTIWRALLTRIVEHRATVAPLGRGSAEEFLLERRLYLYEGFSYLPFEDLTQPRADGSSWRCGGSRDSYSPVPTLRSYVRIWIEGMDSFTTASLERLMTQLRSGISFIAEAHVGLIEVEPTSRLPQTDYVDGSYLEPVVDVRFFIDTIDGKPLLRRE